MDEHVTFNFPDTDFAGVEGDVGLSIFTAECIYGRPKTRLEAAYWIPDSGKRAVFETRGPAGEAALRVLIGLLGARFGEGGFSVERAETGAQS